MAEERNQKNHFQKITPFGADITPGNIKSRGNVGINFLEDFQTSLGAPALSTFYKVTMDLGPGISNVVSGTVGGRDEASLEDYLASCGVLDNHNGIHRFELLANEAVLPGSTMSVVTETGSRQGITEKFASQRAYNDIAISYYIPADYSSLRLFQEWINFINPLYFSAGDGEEAPAVRGAPGGYPDAVDKYGFHRFRYPNEYKKTMSITKFERNVGSSTSELTGNMFAPNALSYKFINIFPTAIQDVALTYQNSTVLQITVEFAYDRYVMISNYTKSGYELTTLPTTSGQNKILNKMDKEVTEGNSGQTEVKGNFDALQNLSNTA